MQRTPFEIHDTRRCDLNHDSARNIDEGFMNQFALRPRLVLGIGIGIGIGISTLTSNALAWSDEGHEIVAVIAYARLNSDVRKSVDAMLAADKDKLTAADFVSRATWADRYRDSDRNTTKVHYNATHNWHFVDIEIDGGNLDAACNNHPPLPANTPASSGPAADCVVDKIDQFATELGSAQTTKAEKILALKFLIHFVGDLHQPLHAADHKDRGGNAVAVLYATRTVADNLHAYWDKRLVDELGHDPKQVGAMLNKTITQANVDTWSVGSPAAWAQESFTNARNIAYNFSGETVVTDDHGGKAERLDATYDSRALPVVKEQLCKAGVRLAAILNAALK